jgi:hypothetical protein
MQVSGYDVVDIVDNTYTQGAGPDDPALGRILLAQSNTHMLDMNGGGSLGGIYQDVVDLTVGQQITLSLYAGQWIQNGAGSLT